jgi:hypothetical protein
MDQAINDENLIQAAPDSPEHAVCPACGGAVKRRKRRTMDGQTTYFYRHENGVGETCTLRYHPCRR